MTQSVTSFVILSAFVVQILAQSDPTVTIAQGTVVGAKATDGGDYNIFYGIPYAGNPANENRFKVKNYKILSSYTPCYTHGVYHARESRQINIIIIVNFLLFLFRIVVEFVKNQNFIDIIEEILCSLLKSSNRLKSPTYLFILSSVSVPIFGHFLEIDYLILWAHPSFMFASNKYYH